MNTKRLLAMAQPRNKDDFGSEVCGYYDGKYIVINDHGTRVDINSETLRGCTGLKDVNDRLIFEGDYVKVADGDEYLGLVVWFDSEGRYLIEFDDYGAKDWETMDGYDWEVVDV